MEPLKISSISRPRAAAGAIAAALKEKGEVDIHVIGAAAVNQAIKSIAIAREYVISSGMDLFCVPAFSRVSIDEEEKTAIKLHVKRHHP